MYLVNNILTKCHAPKKRINRSCCVLVLLCGSYTFLKRKSKSLRLSRFLRGLAGGAILVLSATTDSQTTKPQPTTQTTILNSLRYKHLRVYSCVCTYIANIYLKIGSKNISCSYCLKHKYLDKIHLDSF